MILSSEAMTVLWIIYLFTSVDVAHADVPFVYIYTVYTAMYLRLTVVTPLTRDQRLKRSGMLSRVAQNKWDICTEMRVLYCADDDLLCSKHTFRAWWPAVLRK